MRGEFGERKAELCLGEVMNEKEKRQRIKRKRGDE